MSQSSSGAGVKAPLMVSVSGVRGLIGQSLTPAVAMEFGQAFAHFLRGSVEGKPTVVIGRDSRTSGPMVMAAVTAGLLAMGVNVTDVGVATTPSVALMGRFLKASAAIVITASHNPIPWNGIKFLRHDGVAYPPEQAAALKEIWQTRGWEKSGFAGIEEIGTFAADSRAHAHHVQTVLQYFDTKRIIDRHYRVVLDSVNGAGCIGTPILLGKLGVELVHLNGEATGVFAHTPEPTKENLTDLCAKVRDKRAAVGFAQDPDADRLAVVDERGVYIGEEYTLALCTYARMLSKPVDVVANLSTSRMVDGIAERFGKKVFRTPVGEANVAGKMMADWQAGEVIGGEGNGGIIDLRVGPVRDSFLGMAMVLDVLARTGKSVSELVAELPKLAMIKTKFECTPEQSARLVASVKEKFADQKLDTQDGVRIDWAEGWVHVRQSNTEPIARIIAEAAEEGMARELVKRVEVLRT